MFGFTRTSNVRQVMVSARISHNSGHTTLTIFSLGGFFTVLSTNLMPVVLAEYHKVPLLHIWVIYGLP